MDEHELDEKLQDLRQRAANLSDSLRNTYEPEAQARRKAANTLLKAADDAISARASSARVRLLMATAADVEEDQSDEPIQLAAEIKDVAERLAVVALRTSVPPQRISDDIRSALTVLDAPPAADAELRDVASLVLAELRVRTPQ